MISIIAHLSHKQAFVMRSQSELVERSVMELVDTLRNALSPEQRVNLTAEEGYACIQPDTKNKKQRCGDCQPCCYYSLLNYFTQRNTEALVKCQYLFLAVCLT